MYCKCYYEFLISQRSRYNNKGFSKEVEIIDIWSQVSPRTLLVPRAVTPFSNRDVLSGHVYQRKQLSKIKFTPAAPPKQMHIVLQNLDLFKNWISKPRCYTAFPKLGSVAGPVIQANGRLTYEDDLRSGGLLCLTTQ